MWLSSSGKSVINMSKLKPIITSRSLELGDNFDDIKDKIESDKRYAGLEKLCQFYDKGKRLEYCTERIHPNHSEHPARMPILLLFSNPHPDSVRRGLFLSGPHSRPFWQRLFESDHLRLSVGEINLKCWDESTPKVLGQLMLEGKYKSKFLLYFHCLWPIPTNQVADLKRLFASKPQLWERVDKDSEKELVQLIEYEQIKSVVTFTGEVFGVVTGVRKAEYKGRRDQIKHAVNDFLKDGNTEEYWERLSFYHAEAKFSNNVDVYLGLDTHAKNWGKGMKRRYFTLVLDMIFKRILETNGVE